MAYVPRLPHVWSSIPGFKWSIAYLSSANTSDVDRAIVFVHGFSGSARSTWSDFLSLVDDKQTSQWWEATDLYFFDYWWDSIFKRIPKNTNTFERFLEYVFPKPPQELFEAAEMTLRPAFEYKYLTLVGHSEGGLIVRKVILNVADTDTRLDKYMRDRMVTPMKEPDPEGIEVAQLRLFAPALGGESLTGPLGIITHCAVIAPFLHASAAKTGMAETSSSVTTPRSSTDRYTDHLAMECFRAHILWADNDAIVNGERYRKDAECKNLPPGTNHVTVCKPSKKYQRPLTFVESGVVNGKC
jgi:pimeloyl-ACP methyl ester carboxylesterase